MGKFFSIFSVRCPKRLLNLDDYLFLKIWEVFCYSWIQYAFYALNLYFFFMLMICMSDLLMVPEILHVLFVLFYFFLSPSECSNTSTLASTLIFCLQFDPACWRSFQLSFIWHIELFHFQNFLTLIQLLIHEVEILNRMYHLMESRKPAIFIIFREKSLIIMECTEWFLKKYFLFESKDLPRKTPF
jgi:hypothetical protein